MRLTPAQRRLAATLGSAWEWDREGGRWRATAGGQGGYRVAKSLEDLGLLYDLRASGRPSSPREMWQAKISDEGLAESARIREEDGTRPWHAPAEPPATASSGVPVREAASAPKG